jgi:hypothetical protein
MASVTLSYDVKIVVVRPFITKNLSDTDLSRINKTTTLKYETLTTNAPQAIGSGFSVIDDEEVLSALDQSIAELDEIHDEFDDLAKRAEEALKNIVYTYDITLPENELTAQAERDLFGSATGVITFEKYKKLMELEDIINVEIQERMINNGGKLDVAS